MERREVGIEITDLGGNFIFLIGEQANYHIHNGSRNQANQIINQMNDTGKVQNKQSQPPK